MARKVYDVVAVVGTYTNRNGEEKKRYMNVGAVFESGKGMSMKLEAIPVGPEFNGWLSFYEPKERDDAPRGASRGDKRPAKGDDADPFNDDIPF